MNELAEVYFYYEDCTIYNKNDAFLEMEYRKGRDRWDKLLKEYQSVNTRVPTFDSISLKESLEITKECMLEILGSTYKEKLDEFTKKTLPMEGDNFYTTTEWELIGDDAKLVNFHVTDFLKSDTIWKLGHEYIHGLLLPFMNKKFNFVFGNIHYAEMPSMFMERLVALKSMSKRNEKQYMEKTEALRIEDSKKHATIHLPFLERISLEEKEICHYYFYHHQLCYILSDIYSSRLFDLYCDSPKIVLEKYKLFLEGKLCLLDLLSYFGISLRDSETYFGYQKKLQTFQ